MPIIHFNASHPPITCDVMELTRQPPGIDFEGHQGGLKPIQGFVPWSSVAFIEYEPDKPAAVVSIDDAKAVGGSE